MMLTADDIADHIDAKVNEWRPVVRQYLLVAFQIGRDIQSSADAEAMATAVMAATLDRLTSLTAASGMDRAMVSPYLLGTVAMVLALVLRGVVDNAGLGENPGDPLPEALNAAANRLIVDAEGLRAAFIGMQHTRQ